MAEQMTGITYDRWQTTTVTSQVADDAIETETTHIAHFTVEPGALDDMTPRYGRQSFRPTRMIAKWTDGQLERVDFDGPRVLKDRLSDHDHKHESIERHWNSDAFDRTQLPEAAQRTLAEYERRRPELTPDR